MKWLISSDRLAPEPELWEEHKEYNAKVFSLTEDPGLCETLIADIPEALRAKILIVGCGSSIKLQEQLLERCPNIGEIWCTDLSRIAIDIAKDNWSKSELYSNKVNFLEIDSTKLTKIRDDWGNYFDYVLVVNSVLSSRDEDNRQMIVEFFKSLKIGGKLYGLFPTVFCSLEIAYIDRNQAFRLTDGTINLTHSAIYESSQKRHQIFYTPLRLNQIFRESGFKRLVFEIYFCDSEYFNTKEIYGIDDPDICIWEFLVRFEK